MQKLISMRCAFGKYCARGIAFTFTFTPILASMPATATQIFSSLM
jgi:hypothetical protein